VRLGSLPAAAFLLCFFLGWSPFAPHRVRCGQHHSWFRETSRLIPSKVASVGKNKGLYGTTKIVPWYESFAEPSYSAACESRASIQI
jgi:hypothetical protein